MGASPAINLASTLLQIPCGNMHVDLQAEEPDNDV